MFDLYIAFYKVSRQNVSRATTVYRQSLYISSGSALVEQLLIGSQIDLVYKSGEVNAQAAEHLLRGNPFLGYWQRNRCSCIQLDMFCLYRDQYESALRVAQGANESRAAPTRQLRLGEGNAQSL